MTTEFFYIIPQFHINLRIPVEANATKGAAVIKKIDLSSEKWFEENTEKSQPMQITKPNAVIKDKFFVAPGGENEDDDESGGDDSWDEAVDNNDFLVKESLKLRKERDSLREGVGKKMRSHFCTSLKEPKATEDFDSKKKRSATANNVDLIFTHEHFSYEREGMTQGRRHERPREDQKSMIEIVLVL